MNKILGRSISIIFLLCLFSCRRSSSHLDHNNLLDTSFKLSDSLWLHPKLKPDTANQYIYDFMQEVIRNQHLDLSFGLSEEPEPNCDLSQNDSVFLKTLLKENTATQNKNNDPFYVSPISMGELPKCLTTDDINHMLTQKKTLNAFTWSIRRLGFNSSNNANWYCFSIPLFSKDKSKAVMMIRNLCPGLCGTGWTVVFTKEKNKWTSTSSGTWIH